MRGLTYYLQVLISSEKFFLRRMNNDKIILTQEGLVALKNEHRHLLEEKRPLVVERLSESRQAGDLAENSEYTQAREELSFIDGRISELEGVLGKATLIKKSNCGNQKVDLGCKVTVSLNGNKTKVFHLVGDWEADPAAQKISLTSPLGKSLLGRKVGERTEVEAPAGKIVYTIVKID